MQKKLKKNLTKSLLLRKENLNRSPKSNRLKKEQQAYHIVNFVDVLDGHNKKGFSIAMDNSRIHHSLFAVEAINLCLHRHTRLYWIL